MFFHCFGPLLPLFIFFLPRPFWPCCTHFSGWFTMQSGVWGTSATMWHIVQVCASNIKRVTATFCLLVLSSNFDHVFVTFSVSDHVFSLFWPSATIFIFFLPWSFWPCCTHFSGLLQFLRVWPCFFTVLALCYHFLYFSYHGHFDHDALTFQVFFTFDVSDHVVHSFGPLLPLFIFFLPWSFWPCCTHFSGFLHFLRVWPCFSTVLALCYHFLYFSYLGHFDHVCTHFSGLLQFLRVWPCYFTLLSPLLATFCIFLVP